MSSQPTIGISEGRCTRTTLSMLQTRQSSQQGANRTKQKATRTRLGGLRRREEAERGRIPGGSAIYTGPKTARVRREKRFRNRELEEGCADLERRRLEAEMESGEKKGSMIRVLQKEVKESDVRKFGGFEILMPFEGEREDLERGA